jgi:hypothetical protein
MGGFYQNAKTTDDKSGIGSATRQGLYKAKPQR